MAQSTEITNTCTCQFCQDCGCSYSYVDSVECPECKSDMEYFDCGGHCFDDAKDYFTEIVTEWQGDAECYYIEGTGMGWLKKSGWTETLTYPEQALDQLNINTAWHIKLTLDNGELKAVRYSHDELGASFTFVKGEAR